MHPDFKKKDSSLSPLLNEASDDWVLPKLERLGFDVFVPKARGVKQLKGQVPIVFHLHMNLHKERRVPSCAICSS